MALHATYAQRLADGRYEYGRLITRWRVLGAYQGVLAHYSEWEQLPSERLPYGTVDDYGSARNWMALIERD